MSPAYTPRDLAILVPLLGRPHHLPPLLASIDATVPGARVVLLVTPGDSAVAAAEESGRQVIRVPWQPRGDFQRKTNRGYRETTEPLLFVGASDLEFQPGWFQAAVEKLTPDIGIVGTNDMCNPRVMRGDHATHFLVTREYADLHGTIDQPRMILHEGYRHEMCDDEAIGTARYRNAFAMALDSRVRHLHPLCLGEEANDEIYRQQAARMRESWPLFRRRRRLWDPTAAAVPVRRRVMPGRRR